MDWISFLDQRRKPIIAVLLLIAVATLALSSMRDPFALDSFWHLKTGQDLIEKGLSPFIDHYSFTFKGEPISGQPVIFQVILYGFVQAFGLAAGFKSIVFFAGFLTLVMTLWWLRQIKAPAFAICLAIPILVALLQQRAMVRPELLSYALMVLSLVLSEKARTGNTMKIFPFIFLTLAIWTNYHSVILGYVIFFGLFVELAVKHLKDRASLYSWLSWLGWGVLVLVAGSLNQKLANPVFGIFSFSTSEWTQQIGEYRPSLLGEVSIVTLGLIPISLVTLILLLRQRHFGYVIVCLIFSWSAISMIRMVTPSGIVILCLFTLALSESDMRRLLRSGNTTTRALVTIGNAFLFAGALFVSVLRAQQLVQSNQVIIGNFPDRLVQYMKENGKSGNIFNEYRIGGYLIYELGDENLVYIDGRTNILYPLEHLKRWQEAMSSPEVLRSEIEKHQIDYVVIGHRRDLVELAFQSGVLSLDYSDLRYSLYSKNGANFPVSGNLWHEAWCWNERISRGLVEEEGVANDILPTYSPILHLINMASAFDQSKDKKQFLNDLNPDRSIEWHDGNYRFAGFRALELGQYELAIEWFYPIREKILKDFLAGAMANLRAGRPEQAEDILYAAIQRNWKSVEPGEFLLLHRLLNELQEQWSFVKIGPDYLDELTQLIGQNGAEPIEEAISVAHFCGTPY